MFKHLRTRIRSVKACRAARRRSRTPAEEASRAAALSAVAQACAFGWFLPPSAFRSLRGEERPR